jgi:hypothetical protein
MSHLNSPLALVALAICAACVQTPIRAIDGGELERFWTVADGGRTAVAFTGACAVASVVISSSGRVAAVDLLRTVPNTSDAREAALRYFRGKHYVPGRDNAERLPVRVSQSVFSVVVTDGDALVSDPALVRKQCDI